MDDRHQRVRVERLQRMVNREVLSGGSVVGCSHRSVDHVDYCDFLLKDWTEDEINPPPLLTGHDLTRHGLEPGPLFKELLEAVREAQLDGAVKNTTQALALVDQLVHAKKKK